MLVDMFKNPQRYNKFWVAILPLLVYLVNLHPEINGVTVEDAQAWTDQLWLLMGPLLTLWVRNEE